MRRPNSQRRHGKLWIRSFADLWMFETMFRFKQIQHQIKHSTAMCEHSWLEQLRLLFWSCCPLSISFQKLAILPRLRSISCCLLKRSLHSVLYSTWRLWDWQSDRVTWKSVLCMNSCQIASSNPGTGCLRTCFILSYFFCRQRRTKMRGIAKTVR
jgi:hypothetical protein